jgi:protein-L-isoaspartate(D-aspartate) O-methyltransferase
MNRIILISVFAAISLSAFTCDGEESEMKMALSDDSLKSRQLMVEQQIRRRGVKDQRVLDAMLCVPRHLFVPEAYRTQAYEDYPLSIGHSQTISQPYIVAYMTEMLQLAGDEKVLEIGTGSGYQAAVLAECAKSVYTIEIVQPLCDRASKLIENLGYENCTVRCGDGYDGWPEQAPFDAIMVTAAPKEIPQVLIDQLAPNGRMIIPVGAYYQHLKLITKDAQGRVAKETMIPVRFVPMTGGQKK